MDSGNWKPGDLVFAKMFGYPAWPARVEFQCKVTGKYIWYKVFFFGTKQMGECKGSQIYPYLANKTLLGGTKKNAFINAMQEIEEEWHMNKLNSEESSANDSFVMASTSTGAGKRASEENLPKVVKKKCIKPFDSASLKGLLRPCFVKLNRVYVPASGSVKLASSPDEMSIQCATSSQSPSQVRFNKPSITPKHPSQQKTKNSVAAIETVKLPKSTETLSQCSASSQSTSQLIFNRPSITPKHPIQQKARYSVAQRNASETSQKVRMTSKLPPAPKSRVIQQHTLTPHSVSKSPQLPISISELAYVHSYDDVCETPQYECIFCDSVFLTFDQLHSHCSGFHGRYTFCRKCKKYFKSSKQLMLHEVMCLSTQAREIFHCNTCTKSFISKEFLLEHLKSSHTLKRSEDGKGLIVLDPYDSLLEKIKDDLNTVTKNIVTPCMIDCHSCKRQFSIDEYIENHLLQSEAMTQCHCPFCGIDPLVFYLEPIKYLHHIKYHIFRDLNIANCEKCGIKLLNKYNGFTHMMNRHSDKPKSNQAEVVDLEEEIQAAEVTTTGVDNVATIHAHTSTTMVNNSMILPRISSHTSDSSINSDVEVSEYVVEVFDVMPISRGTAPEASKTVDDSCNLLSSMEISQPVEMPVKDIDNFMIHCTVCSSDIPDTEYFESHIKDCAQMKTFPCPLCGIEVTNDSSSHFDEHLRCKMQSIRCRKCNFIFFNCHNQTLHLGNKHYNIK